ncbi:hypothetical protein T265_07886 [Opisthorchis viverrini]|uniref:Uncharacterized protein n=1 Tax=Opisthorchis viverrini TaxID=6198 RepID=A0A074ZM62_OPIVI|nr:hypothetical protein T265_07886 [Opisthorchis viverrini]KER24460.1 hypothetical protein T265_07886 [Opisthorchis viverrini]
MAFLEIKHISKSSLNRSKQQIKLAVECRSKPSSPLVPNIHRTQRLLRIPALKQAGDFNLYSSLLSPNHGRPIRYEKR